MPKIENSEYWRDEALCAQTDPEIFFPEKGSDDGRGKRICARCDAKTMCLAFALENDERYGIWGGLSARDRTRIRKELQIKPLTQIQVEREERDRTIASMADRGYDALAIAEKLGVSEKTVYRVLQRHHRAAQEVTAAAV